jgi:hypothetical protein
MRRNQKRGRGGCRERPRKSPAKRSRTTLGSIGTVLGALVVHDLNKETSIIRSLVGALRQKLLPAGKQEDRALDITGQADISDVKESEGKSIEIREIDRKES